jgi:hypothetical protein
MVFLVACGGTTQGDDASVPDASDATITDSPFNQFDQVADEPPVDAGLPYVVIDGGNACGATSHESCKWPRVVFSCCNGTLCAGQCVLFQDAQAPECYCAGLNGGCPANNYCCIYNFPQCISDPGTCPSDLPPCP